MIYKKADIMDLDSLTTVFNNYRMFYQKDYDVEGASGFLSERIRQKDSEIYVALNNDNTIVGFVQLYPLTSVAAF